MREERGGVWIGVDVGTTGVRAVAYRADGTALASSSAVYPLEVPRAGWAQQDLGGILAETERVIADVAAALAQRRLIPDGIALSTAMHSFAALDEARRPLLPLLIWADGRSAAQVERMKAEEGLCRRFYEKSCCPAHVSYPLAKLLWLRAEAPELYGKMRFVGSLKDCLFLRLTGEWALDRSVAGGSGLYNAAQDVWDAEILAYAGLSARNMPPVVPTTYSRPLGRSAAAAFGLPSGLPVVIGASDGVLAGLGIGVVRPGQLSATIGTSGAVRMLADRPLVDAKQRTWCYHLVDGAWVVGGAINNGGITLRWMRDEICGYGAEVSRRLGVDAYDLMTLQAARVAPGSEGLIFLPFFSGERAPYWNAEARASFFGLSLSHTRAHLIRAAMEGVCYSMHSIFAALEDVVGAAEEIRVSGSFTKSPLWLQMLADVFGRTIHVPGVQEGAAFGAAVLGFLSTGEIDGIARTAEIVKTAAAYRPQPQHAAVYRRLFAIYEDLYQALKPQFRQIAAYQDRRS